MASMPQAQPAALDLSAEEAAEFAPVVRLAAQLCAAPIALLALVDDQQIWFAARLGLTTEYLPLEQSLCREVIATRNIVAVRDAAADPRFAHCPLVAEGPLARAYLGIPLITADAHCIGAVCVLDTAVRSFDEAQVSALNDLALLAIRLMNQRSHSRRIEARQAMLDSLLEALPEGIVACDADGGLSLFNSKARKWHESDPLQMPPEEWPQYFHLYEADGHTQLDVECVPLVRAFAGESVRDVEICVKARSQPPRWVSCNGRAFFNASGRRLGAVVAMHDVTERRRYEQNIADVQRHLEAVISASTEVAIIAVDQDGKITLFNTGAERLLGYASEEAVGQLNPSRFHTQAELQAHAAEVSREYGLPLTGLAALVARPARGQNEIRDWTFVRKDGDLRPVRLVVSAILDHAGTIIGYLGVAIDRSQIEAMEAALKISEAQFKAAFDTAPQGMALVSLEGRFVEVNRSLCEISGFPYEELINRHFQRLVHQDDLGEDLVLVRQLMTGAIGHYQSVKRFFTRDRRQIWGQLSVSLVRDSNQLPLYYVGQIQDITKQRELDRLKSEFVGVVSHELRTPLSSIRGALGLINGGALGEAPASLKEMLGLAHRNAERLSWLVDDLLDFEKLSADKLAFEPENHDVDTLIDDALASNRAYAESLDVRLARDGGQQGRLFVDSLRFGQVMANLLSNAIKFSPAQATVTVRCGLYDERLRIEVLDCGAGIPEAFQPRVFEHFAQAEGGNTRRQGGTGLGLAISRQLVERMGGSIGFTSRPGRGTVFWIELPQAPAVTAGACNSPTSPDRLH